MEINRNYRTDLASEAERLARNGEYDLSPLPGVEAKEEQRGDCSLFHVRVLDEEGAQRLGKSIGRYCTLEAPQFVSRGDSRFTSLAETAADLIRSFLGDLQGPYLVVGLGNGEITPDALGPLTTARVLATRHLKLISHPLFVDFSEVSVCTPGVLGSSGLEASLQVGALCREIHPACVLAVDALAGAEAKRLCRTLQITDSGIAPGSGVGNDRASLSFATLGVPVFALGVPTVIDASYLGDSTFRGMFLTPKDIDRSVHNSASFISCALNLALHPGLTLEELATLQD